MKLLNVNATAQFLTPGYSGNETTEPIGHSDTGYFDKSITVTVFAVPTETSHTRNLVVIFNHFLALVISIFPLL